MADFDTSVRLSVYQQFIDSGRAPGAADVASALGCTPEQVEAAFERLRQHRMLVLKPGTREIWMAMPLSAKPTPFRVHVSEPS